MGEIGTAGTCPAPPERVLFESAIEKSFSLVANERAFDLRKATIRDESICNGISSQKDLEVQR